MFDQHAKVRLHPLRVRTNEIASLGSFFDVLRFELGDNVDDSATVAHRGVGFDVLAVEEPVSVCRGMRIVFRDVRIFFENGD